MCIRDSSHPTKGIQKVSTTVSALRESARTVQLSTFRPDEMFFSITDEKGVIAHANSVFTRLSGYSFDEMQGQPHNIVRDPAMPRRCV